jgi:general L-amino acid transport system permease protein
MLEKNGHRNENSKLWHEGHIRNTFYQIIIVLCVVFAGAYLYSNTQHNLSKQNIATGFEFLDLEAGFEISDTAIEYWSDDSYKDALIVGVLNTFKVAIIGSFLAIFFGILVGILRLSPNWILNKLMQTYIEIVRNIPLLLQLFFWYALFTEVFPAVKEAWELIPNVYLSQRGLVFPIFAQHSVWLKVFISEVAAFVLIISLHQIFKKKRLLTGKQYPLWPWAISLCLVLPTLTWLIGGAPIELNVPKLQGFNFAGGMVLTPEYISLMLGLVVYTSAFIAEIVRAGILSVDKGQWEAGRSIGLSQRQLMRLVVLPQSTKVIIPPLTSQILNLVKNSSLAIGIGYPDFVAVANTTMNQTGQAIELVALIMLMYLFFSLSISAFMNIYNKMNAGELTQR